MRSALIFSLLAPLFRRMRATFPQFEAGLKISPPSGKTFIDLFDDLYTYFEAREDPLSALRATLPEGESFSRSCATHSPKGGDLSRRLHRHLPRRVITSFVACATPSPRGEGCDRFRWLSCHYSRRGKFLFAEWGHFLSLFYIKNRAISRLTEKF